MAEQDAHLILAQEYFDDLARRFPVMCASDEFHFFPQAKARKFDWSRWDDFSTESLANAIRRKMSAA